jgi:hypothetical protein
MKTIKLITLLCASLALAGPATAQFVKGNEAVRLTATGKHADLPPIPPAGPARLTKPCAADAECHAGSWHMVETANGLMECTEPYARPGTCRRSTYGKVQISRLWIVKTGGAWRWCQYPDLDSKCVDMYARPPANLPYAAVQ